MMFLLSLALAAATPASDADRADMQCIKLFAMTAVEAQNDPDRIATLRLDSAYFMGRINGRSPGVDVTALTQSVPPSKAPAVVARCQSEIDTVMGGTIQAVRDGLTAAAK